MEYVDIHMESTVVVFLHRKRTPVYEAHFTSESGQRRGWGSTPRAAIFDALTEEDNEGDWCVGVTETAKPLRRFRSHDEASAFIGTLEGAEDGLYFLDGPER